MFFICPLTNGEVVFVLFVWAYSEGRARLIKGPDGCLLLLSNAHTAKINAADKVFKNPRERRVEWVRPVEAVSRASATTPISLHRTI